MHIVRVWDLPTRLFHWLLAILVVAMVVTAKVGGNWMEWHLRLGHLVLALLVFRLAWGFLGGHWSRFASFVYAPSSVMRYLRGEAPAQHQVGHSPLGALSVFALLGVLLLQVTTGLMSDDEISFAGPLTRFVSADTVGAATSFHKDVGQWLVLGLVLLHVAAILVYQWVKRQNLVGPMVGGDKTLAEAQPSSNDGIGHRLLALVLAALSAAGAWAVYGLGFA